MRQILNITPPYISFQPVFRLASSSATIIKDAAKKSYTIAKDPAYHAADFMRIFSGLHGRMGAWSFQLFVELARYNAAPSMRTQQTWVGWLIFGLAVSFTLAAKSINFYKRKQYPAAQDYLFAAFASSALYSMLDTLTESNRIGSLSIGWFTVSTLLLPVLALLSIKFTLPDSADHIIRLKEFSNDPSAANGNTTEKFPHYADATRGEKALNALTSAMSYGFDLSIPIWAARRELNKGTVGEQTAHAVATAGYFTLCALAGSQLTSYPRLFHLFIALSKAARDGAYAYASFSGLAFLGLMYGYGCADQPCWDESINNHLTIALIIMSTMVGLFSGATTLFKYQENHQANQAILESMGAIKEKVTESAKSTGTSLSNGMSNAYHRAGDYFARLQSLWNRNKHDEQEVHATETSPLLVK